MGNANVKKLQAALENSEQEKEIQNLFNHYDKNKNGKIELNVKKTTNKIFNFNFFFERNFKNSQMMLVN